MNFFLNENVNVEDTVEISQEITEETAKTAEAFVRYFAEQRKILNKVKIQ